MAYGETYEEFIEKFKPKTTTDDCHTPPEVYEAVKNWAINEYNLQGCNIVRPFYPGGDYQKFEYGAGTVVIDNPPFSILSKIVDWYNEHDIKFFLFAPHLTLFSTLRRRDNLCGIVTDCNITYQNGAKVNTAFMTNMDKCVIRTAPDLKQAVKQASEKLHGKKKALLKYTYPKNVISAALLSKYSDHEFSLNKDEVYFITQLDEQKKYKKGLYGKGYLISDRKAEELQCNNIDKPIEWQLSEREKEIIRQLNRVE